MARGGLMAAQDALVLVQELAAGHRIDEALARYASRRRPRTAHVQGNHRHAQPARRPAAGRSRRLRRPPLGRTERRLLRRPAIRAVTKTPRTIPATSILTPQSLACLRMLLVVLSVRKKPVTIPLVVASTAVILRQVGQVPRLSQRVPHRTHEPLLPGPTRTASRFSPVISSRVTDTAVTVQAMAARNLA